MRKTGLLLIGLLLGGFCNSQALNKFDWTLDLDFIAEKLPQKHYDFFTVRDKATFLSCMDNIKQSSNDLTDFEVAIKLQQLLSSFGDSHTGLNFGQMIDKNRILPLHLYWFSDGLYVLHTTQENSEILGHQIVSLNEIPLKTIIDSLSTLLTLDNQAVVKKSIPKLFPLVQVLAYFGFVTEQTIELGLKDASGTTKTHRIKPAAMNRQNRKMFLPDSLALCFKNESAFFVDVYQKEDHIYYLQYNRCWSKELELKYGNAQNAERMPSFKAFEEKVFHSLHNLSINKVVFDLRFNGGGNSAQGTEFIETFSRYLENNNKLKIYVILGRNTFSSALLNAMDFKRLTNATFIGEETSGKPNHFGEVRKIQLPASGLSLSYSTKYFKKTNKELTTLAPDILREPTFLNFSQGVDPAYEWIKKH